MMSDKISNAQIKHLRALQLKKFRQKYNQFIVEGIKSVDEFVQSPIKCLGLFGNEDILNNYQGVVDEELCYLTNNKQLSQISALKNPQSIVGLFEIPDNQTIDEQASLVLVLDDIRDPGNLGTMIRTADWFGLHQVVCSTSSVDCYNSKVIQASMGSLSRMKVHYINLGELPSILPEHTLILTDMEGENYKDLAVQKAILVIGNEGQGISEELRKLEHQRITIPRKGKAESLNAAVSAAILLAALS